jgi:hypothetical protein
MEIKAISLLLLITLLGVGCVTSKGKFQKKYPQYVSKRNVIKELPKINDSTLLIQTYAQDIEYGLKPEKPIFLGIIRTYDAIDNVDRFFNALLGKDGQILIKKRMKACCPFKTPNSTNIDKDKKFGLLEVYQLSYAGLEKPIILYINLYDEGALFIPRGFKSKF